MWGSQQQAGPWAPLPLLISSPALQDCCSLISATLLSQQPSPGAPWASRTPAVTPAPGRCPDATGMGSAAVLHSPSPQPPSPIFLIVPPSFHPLHPTPVTVPRGTLTWVQSPRRGVWG